MRSTSPYATRPFPTACRATNFRYSHIHAAHAHGVHLTDSSAITRYAPFWSRGLLLRATHYAPVVKLLLLILLWCLVQVVVLHNLVIQIVAIKTLVIQVIAATRYAPEWSWSFSAPIAKDLLWTHGQRMVTHNYTLLNNY